TASPNRVTAQKLADARARFPQLGALKKPLVAVLVGGDSKAHRLTRPVMEKMAAQLGSLDAGLMVTASRRTGPENESILRAALSGKDAYILNGTGENPYFAMLGYADYIVVTSDSVSMLSEAATTGKP